MRWLHFDASATKIKQGGLEPVDTAAGSEPPPPLSSLCMQGGSIIRKKKIPFFFPSVSFRDLCKFDDTRATLSWLSHSEVFIFIGFARGQDKAPGSCRGVCGSWGLFLGPGAYLWTPAVFFASTIQSLGDSSFPATPHIP